MMSSLNFHLQIAYVKQGFAGGAKGEILADEKYIYLTTT